MQPPFLIHLLGSGALNHSNTCSHSRWTFVTAHLVQRLQVVRHGEALPQPPLRDQLLVQRVFTPGRYILVALFRPVDAVPEELVVLGS